MPHMGIPASLGDSFDERMENPWLNHSSSWKEQYPACSAVTAAEYARVHTARGSRRRSGAFTSRRGKTEHMTAESTKTSLPVRRGNGGVLPPSERVAALPSTPTALQCFGVGNGQDDRYKALAVIFLGMCSEMLSGDAFILSLHRARNYAQAAGIPDHIYDEVEDAAVKAWAVGRGMNPAKCLF